MKTDDVQQQSEHEQEETTQTIQEETTQTAQEPTPQPQAEIQPTKTPFYKNRGFIGVLLVLLGAILACLVYVTQQQEQKVADKGIAYAKEDNLYLYDLEHEPYLVAEGLSAGGQYHQYYTAWGTTFNEDGTALYYTKNTKEDGTFDLYHKGVAKEDADVEIAKGVMDYMPSQTGEKAILLKAGEQGQIDLYLYNGTETILVEKNIVAQSGSYAISGSGEHMMYQKQTEQGIALYEKDTRAESEPICLHENIAIAFMSAKTDAIYYAGMEGETYTAYVFEEHGQAGKEISKNVTYLEIMPNGTDVLLMTKTDDKVLYTDLVEDDLAESDANLTEADGEAYQAKQARDTIREAVKNQEGIAPLLQTAWVYHDHKLTEVATDLISATSVKNDAPFVVCYQAPPAQKLPISKLTKLEDIEYGYYMSLMYGVPKMVLANAKGQQVALEGEMVTPANIFLSEDGKMVGYYAVNPMTGTQTLHVANVGGEVMLTEENVETAGFLGNTHTVAYYKDYQNGVGTMGIWQNGSQQNIANVGGIHFAVDEDAVYYISNINPATGCGELYVMQDGKSKRIDTDVFSMQYKFNGKLAYFKQYDAQTQTGDLYYYNGNETKQIDTDITAIFMY